MNNDYYPTESTALRPVKWLLALFVLAGLTGFLYRLQMVWPLGTGLDLTNIRHAHSHLMFFSWATVGPMWFAIRALKKRHRKTSLKTGYRLLYGMMALALLSWPFFLGWGYHPVPVGSAGLPLSVMIAGLIMLVWYGFAGWYYYHRRGLQTDTALLLYDGALLLLVLSTLGAWGISLVQMSDVQSLLLSRGMTGFFLTVFTEGWCVLAGLALWLDQTGFDDTIPSPAFSRGVSLLALSTPLLFPFGLSAELLNPILLWAARAGAIMNGIGIAMILKSVWNAAPHAYRGWWLPVGLLAAKTVILVFAASGTEWFWVGVHGFRILYLHVTLLGFLSLAIAGAGRRAWKLPRHAYPWFAAAVIALLAGLIPLTPLWPVAWSGMWVFQVAAAAALLPVLAGLYLLFSLGSAPAEADYETTERH